MHKSFDHDSFATICDRFVGPQLISYNSSQLVKDRFKDYEVGEFDLTYTMRSVGEYMREQKERKELVLFNYGIKGLANSINLTKEDLSEDIKSYPPYIVNRCLSGHLDACAVRQPNEHVLAPCQGHAI